MKISISGNIGVGKSSLAEEIFKVLSHSIVVPEIIDHNPFIQKFYDFQAKQISPGPNPFTFPNQLLFLKMNHDHEKKFRPSNFQDVRYFLHDRIMLDAVYVFTHLLHDSEMMTNDEFKLFCLISEDYISQESYPDCVIMLHAPLETLLKRIAKRGREMEKKIDKEYLRKIDRFYAGYTDRIQREEPRTKVIHMLNEEGMDLEKVAKECCDELLKLERSKEPIEMLLRF